MRARLLASISALALVAQPALAGPPNAGPPPAPLPTPLTSPLGGTGLTSIPSGGLTGLSGTIVPGSQIVDVESYRQAADGTDWGPAIRRAIASLSGAGTIRISTPGTLQIATQVSIPQGNPYIALACASRATNLQAASSLTQYMFAVSLANANGGINIDVSGCSFSGATKSTALGFYLNNANAINFQNVSFSSFATAINTSNGYGITLDGVVWMNVTTPFTSSTAAHNLVARRNRCYNCGNVYYIGGFTYSIDIEDGDYETINTVLSSSGGGALHFVGNYVEYPSNDVVYNSASMYGADVSDNYLSYGTNNWNMSNFVGGQFAHNYLYNMNVYLGGTSSGVNFTDNWLGGTAAIGFYGSENHAFACKNASFTADATVHNAVIAGSCPTNAAPTYGALTANVVETLPSCTTALSPTGTGRTYGLKKMDSSSFTVSFAVASGNNANTGVADTIDGAASTAISTQYGVKQVQCDGYGHWNVGLQ